jgi:hypothetical protein
MSAKENNNGCFGLFLKVLKHTAFYVFVGVVWFVISDSPHVQWILGLHHDQPVEIPKKVVWVVPEPTKVPEFVEGVVAEAPIPLGGGICLVGVSFGNSYNRWREVRAVLVSADRPLVLGQKVKVKIRLISETRRPASDLLVIQDDIPSNHH